MREKRLDAGDVVVFRPHAAASDRFFKGRRRRAAAAAAVGESGGVAQPVTVGGGYDRNLKI